jgi:hypothetical protein
MHPKQEELENELANLCRNLDNYLEDKYGQKYRIHPNRLKRGAGSNPRFDGLFSTSIAFSLGYGSKSGRGYIVEVDIRTLDRVTEEDRQKILEDAFDYIKDNLKIYLPERELDIVRDGDVMKIVGDFSLGEV